MRTNLSKAILVASLFLSLNVSSLTAQTINLNQNTSQVIDQNNGTSCGYGAPDYLTSANSYIRAFKISDYTACDTFSVDSIKFGIAYAASVNGSQTIGVNLYSLNSGTVPTTTNITLLSSNAYNIYDDFQQLDGQFITVPAPASIPGSGTLVVEIASTDGATAFDEHYFYMGSNGAGQTKPSYWFSECNTGIIDYSTVPTASPVNLLISVYGRPAVTQPGTFVNPTNPVCDKSTVAYSVPAVTGMTYSWTYSGTGVTISNSNTNTASLTFASGATSGDLSVTAAAGGITSPPRTLAITVNPSPVPAISRAGNVLTATSGFATYQWYRNNLAITNATNSTYTLSQNGSYYVKVTTALGSCNGMSEAASIDDVVGIKDIELANKIKIYPNPAKDRVTIESPVTVNATLTRIDGRVISTLNNVKAIDLKSLAAGMYFITLTDKDGAYLKKEKLIKIN